MTPRRAGYTTEPLRGGDSIQGARDLFEQAYRDFASTVFTVASHIGGDELAEDATQEVFMRYWRRPERFNPERGSLGTYLTAMTRGVALHMRTNGAKRAGDEHAPFGANDSKAAGGVREALQHLKSGEREAIVMAFYGGLTYREVAVALSAAEPTVKSRIRSGLRRLAACVEHPDPTPSN